jgi:hypothetical protein
MKSDFYSSSKKSFLLLTAFLLLGGCAAPIKSRPYVAGESYEGLRYYLSKTTVTVTFVAQLKSCSEGILKNQPSILLLTPTVSTQISADSASSYVINPADSVNWFRKIEVPNLKLSVDGRLSEAEAKSIDSTPAVLLNLIQTASATIKAIDSKASLSRLSTFDRARFDTARFGGDLAPLGDGQTSKPVSTQQPIIPAATCTEDAKMWLEEFNAIQKAYDELRRLPRTLTKAVNFDEHSAIRFKATQDEEQRLLAQLAEAAKNLTVRAELTLVGESKVPIAATLDIAQKWVTETNHYGCDTLAVVAARQKARNAKTPAEEKTTEAEVKTAFAAQPLCIQISGSLSKEASAGAEISGSLSKEASAGAAQPNDSSVSRDGYPGLVFRVPASASISATAVGHSAPSEPTLIANFAVKKNARPASNGWELIPEAPLSFGLKVADARPVLQFGIIAKMPSDVGVLTSNGIQTTFDANGVPASVKWSVEPLPVAALLGLPAQLSGLHPLTAAAPSASAVLQVDVWNKLLQSCINALEAGVAAPSYCANIIK